MNELTDPTSRLLAVRIRAARKARLWTLGDLAVKIDDGPGEYDARPHLSASQLSRIELGQRPVSVPELHAIAAALDLAVDWLMRAGEICPTCHQETTE